MILEEERKLRVVGNRKIKEMYMYFNRKHKILGANM